MKCKVITDFFDKENKERLRTKGEEFEVTEERFAVLSKKKLVEKVEKATKAGKADEKPTEK